MSISLAFYRTERPRATPLPQVLCTLCAVLLFHRRTEGRTHTSPGQTLHIRVTQTEPGLSRAALSSATLEFQEVSLPLLGGPVLPPPPHLVLIATASLKCAPSYTWGQVSSDEIESQFFRKVFLPSP